MSPRLRQWYARSRESFWFLPAQLVLLAAVLAQVAIGADSVLGTMSWGGSQTFALGVDGSRGMLTTIGGSSLAVAATAFSITISVIATASSAYGPRLVRNFIADRGNQFVLGIFVATFVYAVLVLRAIQAAGDTGDRPAFVPYIAVYLGIGVALLNVGVLVWFIHHIADSIQVSTHAAILRKDLLEVVRREYPDDTDEALQGAGSTPSEVPATIRRAVAADAVDKPAQVITPGRAGYLVGVDRPALVSLATELDAVIEVVPMVGSHLLAEETAATTTSSQEDARERIRACLTIGQHRTPHQDVHFAIQQLVELAVRALSPGTNDPYTASNAVDELGSGLVAIASGAEPPAGLTDDEGELRLITHRPRAVDLVDEVYDDLRAHGHGEMRIIRSAIELAARIEATGNRDLGSRARMHVDLLIDAFEDSGPPTFDVRRMRDLAAQRLEPQTVPDPGPM